MGKNYKPRPDLSITLGNALFMLRRILDSPTMTKERLAEELGVNERTIRRYRKALETAGFHLETDANGIYKRFIRLTPEARRSEPPQMITLRRKELTLLFLHLAGIQSVGDTATRQRLWERIHTAMGGETVDTERLSGMLTGFDKAYKSYDDPATRRKIATLVNALYRHHNCRVVYRAPNSDATSTYKIEPYQMFEFDGGLYCFVHQHYHKNVIMLAVERIVEIEDNDEEFVWKKAIVKTIEEKKARAFRVMDDGELLKVKLKFTPAVAFYVKERIWHPSQKLTKHKNGGVTLEFEASGKVEIERWIKSWGEDVKVVRMG